ncbi:MAG: helix-turn-helix domain-containing protein [Defluviitaleaceae bacterium]|nr:helix-turn-helix domain-containing protein [Defluviitaleaceae bacterium]
MDIGDRVKAIRTSVGITQTKFAERIAVSTSYVSEIETKVKEPNERAIRLMAAEFNVNESWIRNGQGAMFKEDVSADFSEAMVIFKALDPRLQGSALKLLTVMAEVDELMQGK